MNLGGVDLCYGRWDCFLHKLTDLGSVFPVTKQTEQVSSTKASNARSIPHELSAIMKSLENPAFTEINLTDSRDNQKPHFNSLDTKGACFTIANNALMRMTSLEGFKRANCDNPNPDILDDYYTNQDLLDHCQNNEINKRADFENLKQRSKSLGSDDFTKEGKSLLKRVETETLYSGKFPVYFRFLSDFFCSRLIVNADS